MPVSSHARIWAVSWASGSGCCAWAGPWRHSSSSTMRGRARRRRRARRPCGEDRPGRLARGVVHLFGERGRTEWGLARREHVACGRVSGGVNDGQLSTTGSLRDVDQPPQQARDRLAGARRARPEVRLLATISWPRAGPLRGGRPRPGPTRRPRPRRRWRRAFAAIPTPPKFARTAGNPPAGTRSTPPEARQGAVR